jgi:hypothetical protein
MQEKSGSTACVYEIRNSVWKNLALFILCLFLDLAALLVLMMPAHRDWSSLGGALFFGLGVVLFGYKLFDRRIKIHADNQGIQDYRTRFGRIAWSEFDSATARTVKGNTYLTLHFRNPAHWLQLSSRWTQWLVSKTRMKFGASISLQNTDVDEQQFVRFIGERIAAASAVR